MFGSWRHCPRGRGDTGTVQCYHCCLLGGVVSGTFVSLQISSSLKGLGTFITFEWQLSSVSLHVGVKVPLVLELGGAHVTGVGGVLSIR